MIRLILCMPYICFFFWTNNFSVFNCSLLLWSYSLLILGRCLVNNFLLHNVQVKIVIIDSVTFHFRQDFEDLALRTRLLSGMALKLMNLAKTYNLAVSNLQWVNCKRHPFYTCYCLLITIWKFSRISSTFLLNCLSLNFFVLTVLSLLHIVL